MIPVNLNSVSANKMTKTAKKRPRTYVNLIGAPLILSSIYFGNPFFLCLFLIVSLFCIYELDGLFNKLHIPLINWMPYVIVLTIAGIELGIINTNLTQIFLITIVVAMVSSIVANDKYRIFSVAATIFSSFWIGIFFLSIIGIRGISIIGFGVTCAMFLSVWLCDSAAFIFGKQFGKKKIAPLISPKKTWVGSSSGLISVILLMLGFYKFNWFNYDLSLSITLILGVIFGGLSQFGDFFESKIKREASVKDSSYFLQGHGGFLDRFDSLMITAPATYLLLTF